MTDYTTTVDTAATREVTSHTATIDGSCVEHFGPCWVTHDGHRAMATHHVVTEEFATSRRLCRDCAVEEIAYCAEFGVHYRVERLVARPVVRAVAPRPSGTTWDDSETGDPVVWVPDDPAGVAIWFVDKRCGEYRPQTPSATAAGTGRPTTRSAPAHVEFVAARAS